jgi:hypothetical protein
MSTSTTASEVTTYSTAARVVLHLGVQPRHLLTVTRLLTSELGASVTAEGDGWNAWGEAVGTDANDASTLHVIADLDRIASTEEDAAAVVARLHREGLAVVSTDRWRTLAALSAFEDWSDEAGGLVWLVGPDGTVTLVRHSEGIPVCGDCLRGHSAGGCEDVRCAHHRHAFRLRSEGQRCDYCGAP